MLAQQVEQGDARVGRERRLGAVDGDGHGERLVRNDRDAGKPRSRRRVMSLSRPVAAAAAACPRVTSVTPPGERGEALHVGPIVLADHHARWDDAVSVDDRACQPRAAPDLDARQQHRPVDVRVGVHADAREQHRVPDAARDDAAARHHRLDRDPAPIGLVVHELGRRQLRLVCPDRPAPVVDVEQRVGRGEIDVGVPVGVDRADVAPVRFGARPRSDRAERERMRGGVAVAHGARHDVAPEVVVRCRIGHVALELARQVVGVEDVDAHARQRAVGGRRGCYAGSAGFSANSTMSPFSSTAMTPNAVASRRGTAMQPTVHGLPLATWSASIIA